jgi:hypothetical protein
LLIKNSEVSGLDGERTSGPEYHMPEDRRRTIGHEDKRPLSPGLKGQ